MIALADFAKAENTAEQNNRGGRETTAAPQTGTPARRLSPAHLKDLFAKIAEALTGKPTPSLARRRRKRREETEKAFSMAAPLTTRLPAPIAQATAYLADVLDWLNHMWNWNQPHPHEQLDQSPAAAQHHPTLDL